MTHDPEAAIGALCGLNDNFRGHAAQRSLEAAHAAVRNTSGTGPGAVQFDGRRALAMTDAEWAVHKRELIAGQQHR
jgi:hypothetical protein